MKQGATLIDVGINRLTDSDDVERFFPGDAMRAKQFAERGREADVAFIRPDENHWAD